MLLRYRGVPYEATPAAVSQALVPESFLTYRGARYKPNLNPSPLLSPQFAIEECRTSSMVRLSPL